MAKNLDSGKFASAKFSAGALFVFYLMVTIEIIMMASPFAAYYYVAYGPVLRLLGNNYWTRWLGAFFLPHMIFPANPIFTFIRALSVLLFYGGIIIFFSAAIPLYYKKFRRQGLVTSGLYRYIRHPQYLGLSLWGLGVLLFWPRFLILVAYIVTLFLYYLLAQNEETRFAPVDYNSYRQATGMFFPNLVQKAQHSGNSRNSGLKIGLAFTLILGVSIGLGFTLRSFTLGQLPQIKLKNLRVVSVIPMPKTTMKNKVQAVLADHQIDYLSNLEGNQTTYLAYLMPQKYMMSALVARLAEHNRQQQKKGRFYFMTAIFHKFVMQLQKEYNQDKPGMGNLRIIFLKVSHEDNSPISPSQAFDIYTKNTPVFYADIDSQTGKVTAHHLLQSGNYWGDIPCAMF